MNGKANATAKPSIPTVVGIILGCEGYALSDAYGLLFALDDSATLVAAGDGHGVGGTLVDVLAVLDFLEAEVLDLWQP